MMRACSPRVLHARQLTLLLQRCSVVYMAIMRRSHPGANCVWLSICARHHSFCPPASLATQQSTESHCVRVWACTVAVAADLHVEVLPMVQGLCQGASICGPLGHAGVDALVLHMVAQPEGQVAGLARLALAPVLLTHADKDSLWNIRLVEHVLHCV